MKPLLPLVLLILYFNSLSAQYRFPIPTIDYNPKTYTCYRTMELLSIDGKAFEDSWTDAAWTDSFVDIYGTKNSKPKFDTKVKMLWDDAYLYIYAELEEEHVWAKLRERDAVIYKDNAFEIFIDPDGDTHNYFELQVNAFETIWDLLLTKPYRDGSNVSLTAFDIRGIKVGVNVKGTINDPSDIDKGWSVEIAIPWSDISELNSSKVLPKDGDQWRMNFSRVQWETEVRNGKYYKKRNKNTNQVIPEQYWLWSPQGILAVHYPEMWGIIEFSYKVSNYKQPKRELSETEKAKWYLRQIYYQLKSFYYGNKRYPQKLSSFKMKKFISEEFNELPNYYGNEKIYLLELVSKDNKTKVTLNNEGLVKVVKDGND